MSSRERFLLALVAMLGLFLLAARGIISSTELGSFLTGMTGGAFAATMKPK